MERRPDQGGEHVDGAWGRALSQATGTSPQPAASIEGVFRSKEIAEDVAERLRAAFPDIVVTVEGGTAQHRVRVLPRR